MFHNKEGFTERQIGYDGLEYNIFLPPVGYIENKFEGGRLERRPILNKEKSKKNQKWLRTELPEDWKKRRKEEKQKQESNKEYVDPELQKFRDQEWDRRINGVWIMIDGEAIYLTGLNYFYLNWFKYDFGNPEFRFIDVEFFYMIDYCIEDPNCYGLNLLGGRRTGKTAKMGVFLYDHASCHAYSYAGLQSKNDTDAKKVFNQNIVDPWRRLPDFFRPEYNFDSKQSKKLEFKVPLKRGQQVLEEDNDDIEGLNSWVNFEDAGLVEYDGYKLHRYGADETGKTEKVDVKERWDKVKLCLRDTVNGKRVILGTCLQTTTVEQLGNNTNPYFKLWDESDPRKRKANGQTISGLYNFFIPADCSTIFDDYGRSLRGESKKLIMSDREGITDQASLMDAIRKDPLSVTEAKMVGAKGNPFNQTVLNQADHRISCLAEPPYTVGNFVWDIPYVKARFDPDPLAGKWHVAWFPPVEKQNRVKVGYGDDKFKPDNEHEGCIGVDPISEGATADSARKSSYAMTVFRNASEVDPELSEIPIADYIYRPDNPEEAYEDNLIACWFYGYHAHIEKNNFFVRNGCSGFVMKRPENTLSIEQKKKKEMQGAGTAAGTEVINLWVNLVKKNISQHGHRYVLPRTIDQLKRFKPELRTLFDLVVSLGFAKTGSEAPYDPKPDPVDITKFWKFHHN